MTLLLHQLLLASTTTVLSMVRRRGRGLLDADTTTHKELLLSPTTLKERDIIKAAIVSCQPSFILPYPLPVVTKKEEDWRYGSWKAEEKKTW